MSLSGREAYDAMMESYHSEFYNTHFSASFGLDNDYDYQLQQEAIAEAKELAKVAKEAPPSKRSTRL